MTRKILIGFIILILTSVAQSGVPLWTLTPTSGTQPTQTVPINGSATVQYLVQNQSNKTKNLVIQPMAGLVQAAPCYVAPKGQAGSSCVLILNITGSALLPNGIHGGPNLCQANGDGSPNPNQCYQPSQANVLNITRGSTALAIITVSPTSLNFTAGNIGSVTVTNSASSSQVAQNVAATIPLGSNIRLVSSNCAATLAIGASCSITFGAANAEGPTLITISGSNTNTVTVPVSVIATPLATISVVPNPLTFTENTNGVITVTNNSAITALNIAANIPGGSNISIQSTTCGPSLGIGASCTITFTATSAEGPTLINISGTNTNTVAVAVTVTATPMATISVVPNPLTFTENTSGVITVTNNSAIIALSIAATIPGGSNISVQSTTCGPSLGIGASCTITFTATSAEGPTLINISGTNTNTVAVSVTVTATPMATLIVNPTFFSIDENSQGSVTVTNTVGSPVTANNVTAVIPGGSNIVIFSNTCGVSLAIGDNCTITFAAAGAEGPTSIDVQGTNTNIVNIQVTVTPLPIITISSPVQMQRIVGVLPNQPLSLQINNASGTTAAEGVTVTAKTGCPDLVATVCPSIAPNGSCTLFLSSPTPYAPCTIIITGDNTDNNPALSTPIAFSYQDGVVYAFGGGLGQVVANGAQQFNSQWTSTSSDIIGALDFNNGTSNTAAIIADPSCSGDPVNCAAQQCVNTPTYSWYLPAGNEMISAGQSLCPGGSCNFVFQAVTYWSSTQQPSPTDAYSIAIPQNSYNPPTPKTEVHPVACIHAFTFP